MISRSLVVLIGCAALLAAYSGARAQVPQCFGEAATIVGTAGDDTIHGTRGPDVIQALCGNDLVQGGGGDDRICGGDGDDRLTGGKGADSMDGGAGNDTLIGKAGADHLVGGTGDDQLFGGTGDDTLSGGPGRDQLDGGKGQNILTNEKTLADLIDANDRAGIRDWALPKTIAEINADVAALDSARRDLLAGVVLDSNADGASRELMLRAMRTVLAQPDLGFYAEIWSYTYIELVGGGFFGTCGHLFLSPDAWSGLSDNDARGVLMHESFHSFNCINGGPVGSLNEGSAIWIAKSSFPAGLNPAETWAEATYGTKLYYRDIAGNPDFPLEAPAAPSTKLVDVYQLLSALDPSQLPWNSTERLVTCFDRYWAGLNRNVDFFAVWLPSAAQATAEMLADPDCRPL